MVPGHGTVPNLVDPQDLADAFAAMPAHISAAVTELMKARAEWVSRGLPADHSLMLWLDRKALELVHQGDQVRKWARGAKIVKERRAKAKT